MYQEALSGDKEALCWLARYRPLRVEYRLGKRSSHKHRTKHGPEKDAVLGPLEILNQYVPGKVLVRVYLAGEKQAQFRAENALRAFARRCAMWVQFRLSLPPPVFAFLKEGREEDRAKTRDLMSAEKTLAGQAIYRAAHPRAACAARYAAPMAVMAHSEELHTDPNRDLALVFQARSKMRRLQRIWLR